MQNISLSSVGQSCLTLCDPMDSSMPGFPVHHQLPELTRTHVHRVGSSHLICVPLSCHLQSFPASGSLPMSPLFTSGGQRIGSFSFSISPSSEHSRLISFRMDWLDLLTVQGTLRSLPHHNSKASILWHSAFFIVQLSHPYMTIGKTIALTRQTFVGKVMSLLFNMLFRLVITFLPRSMCLLISWLESPSAVILEPPHAPKKARNLHKNIYFCFID